MMEINRLGNHAGYSHLRMVTYGSSVYSPFSPIHSQPVSHRFQLYTCSNDTWGPRGTQDFELNSKERKRLISRVNQIEWITLLNHLVSRRSERAFFEVRDRLKQFYGVDCDAPELWTGEWDSEPPRCEEELLMGRLQPVALEDKEGLHGDGDKILHLQLPCGHNISIRKIEILSLTPEACKVQQCPACGQRILQTADDEEISLGGERERMSSFKKTRTTWQILDQKVPTSSGEETFSTAALLQALSVWPRHEYEGG